MQAANAALSPQQSPGAGVGHVEDHPSPRTLGSAAHRWHQQGRDDDGGPHEGQEVLNSQQDAQPDWWDVSHRVPGEGNVALRNSRIGQLQSHLRVEEDSTMTAGLSCAEGCGVTLDCWSPASSSGSS